MLHLSSNARQTIAVHSGHFIQLERPDLVIDSISEVLTPQRAQETSGVAAKKGGVSLERFVGIWEGRCQDGATFVVVALQADKTQLGGTVSIGNMQGDDAGACLLVLAPPVPDVPRLTLTKKK